MRQSRSLVTEGIVLSKKKFSESSIICELFSPNFGKISLLAKGARKANSKTYGILQIGAEIETEMHHNKDSEWFILKKADLKNLYMSNTYETVIYQQAGLEIFRQMIIDQNESDYYYSLLKNYLSYQKDLKKNAAAVFWRLLLRIMKKNGISINWNNCLKCGKIVNEKCFLSYENHGIICNECMNSSISSNLIHIDDELMDILKILPQIGKHINEITLSEKNKKNVNKLLISHLNYHFDQHFYIKSIDYK